MYAPVHSQQVQSFYRVAVLGIGTLEARSATARRFGPDADARWNSFRGGLQDWHRVDILVRDAAVRSPAGFAPRVVFDLPALADDEPCGPDWLGPAPGEAAGLLREAATAPRDPGTALRAAASIWGLTPVALAPAATAGIQPATRFLLAGAGAVQAVATAFIGRPELDLADQALLLADDPGTRQLFGLALAFLDTRRPARLAPTTATPEHLRALDFASPDRLLMSEDLAPEARARVSALPAALGVKA